MKRKIIIILSVIAIFTLIVVGYSWYRTTQIDASWVETANDMLRNYQSYINDTIVSNPAIGLSYLRMYVFENGTDKLLYYGNGDALSNYLEGLLRNATIQKGTITNTHLKDILASGKAVVLAYRLVAVNHLQNYSATYFILDDNQNEDIKGTIITRELQTGNLNVLALSKLP